MNHLTPPSFETSSPRMRCLFAVVAIAVTLSAGAFIDALANGLGFDPASSTQYVVVAQH
jgi:hypothetical protein